jgi:hypothetical protein
MLFFRIFANVEFDGIGFDNVRAVLINRKSPKIQKTIKFFVCNFNLLKCQISEVDGFLRLINNA